MYTIIDDWGQILTHPGESGPFFETAQQAQAFAEAVEYQHFSIFELRNVDDELRLDKTGEIC